MADEELETSGVLEKGFGAASTLSLLNNAASSLADVGSLLRSTLQNPVGASGAAYFTGQKLFGGGYKEREASLRREVEMYKSLIDKSRDLAVQSNSYGKAQKEAYAHLSSQVAAYENILTKANLVSNAWKISAGLVQSVGFSLAKINETLDVTGAKSATAFSNVSLPGGGGVDSRKTFAYAMKSAEYDVMSSSGAEVSQVFSQLYPRLGGGISRRLGVEANSPVVKDMLQAISEMSLLGGFRTYSTFIGRGDLDEYSKLGVSLQLRNEMMKGTFGMDNPEDTENMFSRMFSFGINRGLSSSESIRQTSTFLSSLGASNFGTEKKTELFNFLYGSAANIKPFTTLVGGPENYRNLLQNDPAKLAYMLSPLFKKFVGENGQMANIPKELQSAGLGIENIRDFSTMLETMAKFSDSGNLKELNKSLQEFTSSVDNSEKKLEKLNLETKKIHEEAAPMTNVISDFESLTKSVGLEASEFLGPKLSYRIGTAGAITQLLLPLMLLRGKGTGKSTNKIIAALAGTEALGSLAGLGGFEGREGPSTGKDSSDIMDLILLQSLLKDNNTTKGSFGKKLNNFRSINSNIATMPGKSGSFLRGAGSAVSVMGLLSAYEDAQHLGDKGSLWNSDFDAFPLIPGIPKFGFIGEAGANLIMDAAMTAGHYVPGIGLAGLAGKGFMKGMKEWGRSGNTFEGIRNIKEGSDIWAMAMGLTDDKRNDYAYEQLRSDLDLFDVSARGLVVQKTGKFANRKEKELYTSTREKISQVDALTEELKKKKGSTESGETAEMKGAVDVNVVIMNEKGPLAKGQTTIGNSDKNQIDLYISSKGVLG